MLSTENKNNRGPILLQTLVMLPLKAIKFLLNRTFKCSYKALGKIACQEDINFRLGEEVDGQNGKKNVFPKFSFQLSLSAKHRHSLPLSPLSSLSHILGLRPLRARVLVLSTLFARNYNLWTYAQQTARIRYVLKKMIECVF